MIIFSVDEMVISDGDGQTDWLSFSNDVHGLPSLSAQMAGRSGRHPALAGIERAGRQFSVLSYFPSDATASSKNALLAWLASGETRRVVGVDEPIPSAAADSVLAWFGPWDIYNNAGTWSARDVMRGGDLTAAFTGSWYTEPAEGVQFATGLTNLVTNPAFATSITTDYSFTNSSGAAHSLYTSEYRSGGACLRCVTGGAGATYHASDYISVSSSSDYTISVEMKQRAGSGYGQLRVWEYNGTSFVTAHSVNFTSGAHDWERKSVTATTGATTDNIKVVLEQGDYSDDADCLWDNVQATAAAYSVPFFYGDTPGCAWTSTANESTSTWTATQLTAADVELPASGTLMGWFKTPAAMAACGTTRTLFDHGGSSGVVLVVSAADALTAYVGGSARCTLTLTSSNFAVDTWYHAAMTWDADNEETKLYLSGAQVGSTGAYATPTDDDGGLDIGHVGGSSQWIGSIDGAVMLGSVLSAADIATVNTAGRSGINPRWLNAACLDSKPMTHNGITTDIGLTSLFQVDGDVAWRQRDGDAEFWTVYATGAARSINNRGNLPAFPQIRITPRTARTSGFTKMRWVAVEWTTPNAATRYPVELSNGGVDLSADAQADGDDIRVYVDGYEVDRWLDGTLVSDVLIWANLDFDAGADLTLNGAISDSVTSLKINEDISDLPETGTLYVGTEAIAYTERNARTRVISGLARGVNGTSAAAHSDDDDIYWIQHDVRIYYGDATLSAPTADDNYKPMFELDTSANDSWVYEEFGEGDGLRAGQWTTNGAFGGAGRGAYTANHGTDADPWEEIGWETDQPNYGVVYLHQPCGIAEAAFTNGEAYYNVVAGSNSHDIGVASSANEFSTFAKDYTHSFSAEDTWEAWSTTQTYITLMPYVGIYAYANYEEVWIEAADCTIEVFKPPVPVVGAAQDAYELACTIANTTTGESIALSLSMVLDDTLIIDTDQRSVVDGDGAGHLSARTLSSTRTEWLQLKPGENTLTYTEAGVVEVDVELLWDARATL